MEINKKNVVLILWSGTLSSNNFNQKANIIL